MHAGRCIVVCCLYGVECVKEMCAAGCRTVLMHPIKKSHAHVDKRKMETINTPVDLATHELLCRMRMQNAASVARSWRDMD